MTSFAVVSVTGEMASFSAFISIAEMIQPILTFFSSEETPRNLQMQTESSMSGERLLVLRTLETERAPQIIRVSSAVVLSLVLLGFVLSILYPGKITGLILPAAFILWWILYREIVRRGL